MNLNLNNANKKMLSEPNYLKMDIQYLNNIEELEEKDRESITRLVESVESIIEEFKCTTQTVGSAMKVLEILKDVRERAGVCTKSIIIHFNISDVNEAIAELEALQAPKGCNACKHLMDNVCNHPGVPEFYAPQYINYSGCGLQQPKKQP